MLLRRVWRKWEQLLKGSADTISRHTEASSHSLVSHRRLKLPFARVSAEGSKPKVKGGENINLPKSPNPETYRSRQTATREAVSCSIRFARRSLPVDLGSEP